MRNSLANNGNGNREYSVGSQLYWLDAYFSHLKINQFQRQVRWIEIHASFYQYMFFLRMTKTLHNFIGKDW